MCIVEILNLLLLKQFKSSLRNINIPHSFLKSQKSRILYYTYFFTNYEKKMVERITRWRPCIDLVSTFNEYLIIVELDLNIYIQLDAFYKQHPYFLLQQ